MIIGAYNEGSNIRKNNVVPTGLLDFKNFFPGLTPWAIDMPSLRDLEKTLNYFSEISKFYVGTYCIFKMNGVYWFVG